MSASRVGNGVAIEWRPLRRADARGVDQILVRNRQAVERAQRARRARWLVGFGRIGHRLFGHQRDDRVHPRVDPFDLRQVRLMTSRADSSLRARRVASSTAVSSHNSSDGGGDGPPDFPVASKRLIAIPAAPAPAAAVKSCD